MMTNKKIAPLLHCTPTSIPEEYKGKVICLAKNYVKYHSLSGLYKMNYQIVYNRACNLVNMQLAENKKFCIETFDDFVNFNTLFYSMDDINTVTQLYKIYPEEVFPFVICFFTRKLNSFKRFKASYIRNLDVEDVDEVMMIALYKTLERYDPQTVFSFSYLDAELFAAITQLGGDMHPFRLHRNDYVNYLKFSYFIENYGLTLNDLEQFLYEINLSDEDFAAAVLTFPIREIDHKYACNITLRKAYDYFALYSIMHAGIVSCTTYDKELDMVLDNTGPVMDTGFEEAELNLYSEQAFSQKKDKRIFLRLTEPEGSTFTNKELTNDYEYTRYALSKLKVQIKKDFCE